MHWEKSSLVFLLLLLIGQTAALAESETNSPTGAELPRATDTKTIVAGDYPDPSILRLGKDYYMVHTSMLYAPGLLIWRSRDLVHWEPVVRALKKYDGDVWAPVLVHHGGKFFIYYPALDRTKKPVSIEIHVITADKIEGPWSGPINLKINGIDPEYVVAPDGARYLYMTFRGKIGLAKLSSDGLSVDGGIRATYEGWAIPKDWKTEGFCLEGPKSFQRDGMYYLIAAEGGTAGASTSHMAVVARSKTPLGPWENSPYNPLIHTWDRSEKWWSTGHASLVETPEGRLWAIFHGYDRENRPLGRMTLLRPLEWSKDGWPVPAKGNPIVESSMNPVSATAKGIEKGISFSDDFKGPDLALQWSFYEGSAPDRIQFKDGALVMKAQGTSPADCSPMCFPSPIGAFEMEVDVETMGNATGGLVLFYNSKQYCASGVSNGVIRWGQRGEMNDGVKEPGLHHAKLRILCDHYDVSFEILLPGEEWKRLPASNCLDMSGFHHNTFGGFLSLRPGLFASGEGTVTFRHFVFRPSPP